MCTIMAANNCSYYEANKIVDGREMSVPVNYDRFLSPQSWPSLPSPRIKERIEELHTNNSNLIKNKLTQVKRSRDSDKNTDKLKDNKYSKVRVLENSNS